MGQPVKPFLKYGRNLLVTHEGIKKMAQKIKTQRGMAMTAKMVHEAIIDQMVEDAANRGETLLVKPKPCRQTGVNYRVLIAIEEGVNMSTSTVNKSVSQFVAENLLISAMSYFVAVAASSWVPTSDDCSKIACFGSKS